MCAQLACVLDVAADKPGNVSVKFQHKDMNYIDYLFSAAAIAPVMEQAPFHSIGQTILDAIRATRRVTNANTNLGIVLLLAPLASVPPYADLKGGVARALMRLTVDDARAAYEAIRLARPGGLGTVDQQDVTEEPTATLREAMALAADRDTIARQFVNDFEQVFEGADILADELARSKVELQYVVTNTYLRLLAKYPDTLVARKHGIETAHRISDLARQILEGDDDRMQIPALMAVSNGPNPGATADLVTASLFVALRRGIIQVPLSKPAPSAE
jgi:triphosphoribosyl-dephospho-CoA synthase